MVHQVLPKNLSINIKKFLPRPQFFCLAPALPSTVLNLDRSAVISVTAVSVLAWKQVAEGEERDLQELLKLRIPKTLASGKQGTSMDRQRTCTPEGFLSTELPT